MTTRAASATSGRSSSVRATRATCSASASAASIGPWRDPLVRDSCRAGDAHGVPELGRDDVHCPAQGAARLSADERADRYEEEVAGPAHPATDDDQLRPEQVRDGQDPAGECLA